MTNTMLNRVIEIQRREQLSDREMAEALQIARPTWNRIRNGHAVFTDELAVRAAGTWPELTRDLLERAARSSVSAATNRHASNGSPVTGTLRGDTGDPQ